MRHESSKPTHLAGDEARDDEAGETQEREQPRGGTVSWERRRLRNLGILIGQFAPVSIERCVAVGLEFITRKCMSLAILAEVSGQHADADNEGHDLAHPLLLQDTLIQLAGGGEVATASGKADRHVVEAGADAVPKVHWDGDAHGDGFRGRRRHDDGCGRMTPLDDGFT